MFRPIVWLIVTSVVVLFNLHFVDGCKCVPTHPQKKFCEADFVYTGLVSSQTLVNNGRTRRYRFLVLHVSKGKRYRRIRIETARESATCGAKLTNHQLYVLSGRYRRGRRPTGQIDTCSSFIATLFSLTSQQFKYLYSTGNQSYRKNCGCKNIKRDSSTPNGCSLPQDMSKWSCYFTTSICQRTGKSCLWKNNKC